MLFCWGRFNLAAGRGYEPGSKRSERQNGKGRMNYLKNLNSTIFNEASGGGL